MLHCIAGMLTALLAAGPLPDSPSVELVYTCQLSPVDRNGPGAAIRDYQIKLLSSGPTGNRSLAYVIDDTSDALPWFARFGRSVGGTSASIANQHRHDGTPYTLIHSLPRLTTPNLAADVTWEEGENEFSVTGSKKVGEWECWVVEVSDRLGRRGTILIDKEDGIVVTATQRVFMGQGDRFEQSARLTSAKPLDDRQVEATTQLGKKLADLQKQIGLSTADVGMELSAEQIETSLGVVPELTAAAEGTAYSRLLAVMNRDLKAHQQRSEAIADLARKFVGQPAPPLRLKTVEGADVDPETLKAKVLVLHFWEYRDAPLTEPYGQIGYLDYLNSRRSSQGVRVVGVAVDTRLTSPETRAAGIRSLRKLREFMNIGYDIRVDHGDNVKTFGDPRQYSAALPLWVVIDGKGIIRHYRSGLYKVDVNRGLEELDAVVADLLKDQ